MSGTFVSVTDDYIEYSAKKDDYIENIQIVEQTFSYATHTMLDLASYQHHLLGKINILGRFFE